MNTFVTSFIDLTLLEEKRKQDTKLYLDHGINLLQYPFNFVVFCDKKSQKILYKNLGENSNIKYVIVKPNNLPIFNLLSKDSKLPEKRKLNKYTYNYMALMLAKTYFLEEAIKLNYFDSTHYIWIDLAIFRLHLNQSTLSTNLYKINAYQEERIRLPGCYLNMYNKELVVNKPDWTACGGLLSGSKEYLIQFISLVNEMILILQRENIIVWEVNLWSCIIKLYPELFDWYHAYHDDSMFADF